MPDGHCLNILLFWRRSTAALVFRVGACSVSRFHSSVPLSHSSPSLIGLSPQWKLSNKNSSNGRKCYSFFTDHWTTRHLLSFSFCLFVCCRFFVCCLLVFWLLLLFCFCSCFCCLFFVVFRGSFIVWLIFCFCLVGWFLVGLCGFWFVCLWVVVFLLYLFVSLLVCCWLLLLVVFRGWGVGGVCCCFCCFGVCVFPNNLVDALV